MAILILCGTLTAVFFAFSKIAEYKKRVADTCIKRDHWDNMYIAMNIFMIVPFVIFSLVGSLSLCIHLNSGEAMSEKQTEYDLICLELTTIGTECQAKPTLDIIEEAENWNEFCKSYAEVAENPWLREFLVTGKQAEWFENHTIEIPEV